ncbi:MAG: hypothetical protein KKC64_14355 [Spirochaetes bacterium]|nr:hypothetical protein [Spirochaetota bacterium]
MMKTRVTALFGLLLAGTLLFAQSGMAMKYGLSPALILEAVPDAQNKTLDQLTLKERLDISAALSLAMQEKAYVLHAQMASFVLPGAGQLITGQFGTAALFGGLQLLVSGASAAGLWYLLPADLKDFSLTHEEHKALLRTYMTEDRIMELLPAIGVSGGGAVLSLVNSVISAKQARSSAERNITEGKVQFEPYLSMQDLMPAMGLRLRMH